MSFRNWLLKEDLFPNKTATVFHRTRDITNVGRILYSGFKPGEGSMYGSGLYTTFDLKSQFKEEMKLYGEYILKFKIANLESFLITSITVAKYVLGKNYKISDQFKSFGWPVKPRPKSMDVETYGTGYEDYDLMQENNAYSSDLALKIYQENHWIEKRLSGMVYYGRKDGHCLVKYKPISNNLTLIGYTEASVDDEKKYKLLASNQGWITTAKGGSIKHLFKGSDKRNNDPEFSVVDSEAGLRNIPSRYKVYRNEFEEELDKIFKSNEPRVTPDGSFFRPRGPRPTPLEREVATNKLKLLLLRSKDLKVEDLIFLLKRYPAYAKIAIEIISKNKPELITPDIISTINHSAYDWYTLIKIILENKTLTEEDIIKYDKDKSLISSILDAIRVLDKEKRKDLLLLLSNKSVDVLNTEIPDLGGNLGLEIVNIYSTSAKDHQGFSLSSFSEILNHLKELGYFGWDRSIDPAIGKSYLIQNLKDILESILPLANIPADGDPQQNIRHRENAMAFKIIDVIEDISGEELGDDIIKIFPKKYKYLFTRNQVSV